MIAHIMYTTTNAVLPFLTQPLKNTKVADEKGAEFIDTNPIPSPNLSFPNYVNNITVCNQRLENCKIVGD